MKPSPEMLQVLEKALETRFLELGDGTLGRAGELFNKCFPGAPALIVADETTFGVAGKAVHASLIGHRIEVMEPFIFQGDPLIADYAHAERLGAFLASGSMVAVAVGSGTINDLVKLGSHIAGKSYVCVGTAASMDGYNSYGASITKNGIKQSIYCPAPVALVCDLDIISEAPAEMNAAGYADLMAKVTSGADWLLADALGVEPIHRDAWNMVQLPLRKWLSDPVGVRLGNKQAIGNLLEGLLMAGFAMQLARTSRPASGAEHQFSHLWDMEGLKHHGTSPSHGFKVGIGTLAAASLYEYVLAQDPGQLNLEAAVTRWPVRDEALSRYRDIHSLPHTRLAVENEYPHKYILADALRERLGQLSRGWPELKGKLSGQLMSVAEIRDKLSAAGAAEDSSQIGISRDRLKATYKLALGIRRRYTILDLANESGLLDSFLAGMC